MKTYILYVDGKEVGLIRAANQNAAEKKAEKKYPGLAPSGIPRTQVVYTEVSPEEEAKIRD